MEPSDAHEIEIDPATRKPIETDAELRARFSVGDKNPAAETGPAGSAR